MNLPAGIDGLAALRDVPLKGWKQVSTRLPAAVLGRGIRQFPCGAIAQGDDAGEP
jgi:hypothetical protein